jgi:hypothetical protein
MTQDLDFLFLDNAAVRDTVSGSDQIDPALLRPHGSGIEVTLVTPAAMCVPPQVADEVARTAIVSDGLQVASESGLVALKLFRLSYQDKADIVALIKTGRVGLSGFSLPAEKMAAFRELVETAATDPHPP